MTKEEENLLSSQGYTLDQIREISDGEAEGLDVSIYKDKAFRAIQMHEIRMGMQEGIAVKKYAKPEYDWFQMGEIRKGLKDGINVEIFSNPKIPYAKMREIRHGLKDGVDLTPYLKLRAGILRELRKSLVSHVSIIDYIKSGYDETQLEEIRLALEEKIKIKEYITPEFLAPAIHEIAEGLDEGLDVSIYASVKYSWQQMREIRMGLESRIDVSQYSNPYYTWQQMSEIRAGLEEGLDVGQYKSLMYTAREMRKKRLVLTERQELKQILDGDDRTKEFEDYYITISADGMEAHLQMLGESGALKRSALMGAISRAGITYGIDEKMIRFLTTEAFLKDKDYIIAHGKKPEDGKDGYYEFFFDVRQEHKPVLNEDGSVDYQNAKWFEMVKQGDRIALYHQSTIGVNGYTVTGKEIIAKNGKAQNILKGKGFTLLSDQKTYVAATSGRIFLKGNVLEIVNVLEVEEVNLATGNIMFDGSVHVRGNVGMGTMIQLTGDLVVDGVVEAAMIQCGGNVIVRCGVNASGMGFVRASGNVESKFYESAKIYAGGDIKANYSLNSELYATGQIIVSGSKGSLAGGVAYAEKGIKVDNAGNRVGIQTVFKIGTNETILKKQRENEKKIQDCERELKILSNGYEEFKKAYPAEVRNTMEMFIKIENALYNKRKDMQKALEEKEELEKKLEEMSKSKAIINRKVYDGVRIEINGLTWIAKESSHVTIERVNDQIRVS